MSGRSGTEEAGGKLARASPEKSAGKNVGFAAAYLAFSGVMFLVLSHGSAGSPLPFAVQALAIAGAITIAGHLIRKVSA